MMIHTAERPHKCPCCGKGFIRRYYLKDHMIKHHGVNEVSKGIIVNLYYRSLCFVVTDSRYIFTLLFHFSPTAYT